MAPPPISVCERLHDDRFASTLGSRLSFVESSHTSLQDGFRTLANVSGKLNMEAVPCLFIDEGINYSFVVECISTRKQLSAFVPVRERVPNSFLNW